MILFFPFFYLTQKEEALATSEIYGSLMWLQGFPGGSVVKNPPANAGDTDSIPGAGRSPGEGNGNPLQYSCLGNLLDRADWRAAVQGVTKSQTQLSNFTSLLFLGASPMAQW